ncbi:hypothetical protein [Legionella shakespearei]|uniref:Uncharacterized protein n=1 Tax=Legionella shakespearei DSM 23087 TaxID=1122169 RepID=A0A0W0YT47_9GAMM|nr:hypothetical protein [Legionella shakespearei]KTD60060.1 hypothetical protein Lsha_1810 [Legionella shakespearei DSM 23087]
MKQSKCVIVKPRDLTNHQKDDIVTLHQKYITLSRNCILELLKPRDKIYLYYHKDTNQLIATVGIQFVQCKNNILIYVGNTVVEDQYKHEGCLPHSLFKSMAYLFLKHPFKNKFWSALSSSSGSFSYAQHHKPCWPSPYETTPSEITDLMEHCIKDIGITEYRIIDGNIVTYDLCNKIEGTFHIKDRKVKSPMSRFFYKLNPNAHQGEQLFFISSFKIYKIVTAIIYSLHHKLIKNPALYHRLKKSKNRNPVASLLLIFNNLISKKVKWIASLSGVAIVFSQFIEYIQ